MLLHQLLLVRLMRIFTKFNEIDIYFSNYDKITLALKLIHVNFVLYTISGLFSKFIETHPKILQTDQKKFQN